MLAQSPLTEPNITLKKLSEFGYEKEINLFLDSPKKGKLTHAFDLEAVILVGGIMNSKEVILPYLKDKVVNLVWTPWGRVEILSAELNDSAGVSGAILMAKEQ